MRRIRGSREGFALLSALWFMVLLLGVGLQVAARASHDRLAAINRIETAQARLAASSGVEAARARIIHRLTRAAAESPSTPLPSLRWLGADTLIGDVDRDAATRFLVTVRDANARLHLNLASVEELRSLMIALRIDAGRADRVAQAIIDWRDPDDLRSPRGAERSDYLDATARALPRNGRYAALEELLDVRGVDGELLVAVRPHLTLVGSGRINPNTASEPVLLAIPGFGPEVVSVLMRLRSSGVGISSTDQLLQSLPVALRAGLSERQGLWTGRLNFEASELEFRSESRVGEGRPLAVAEGGFVRFGDRVIVTERRVRTP